MNTHDRTPPGDTATPAAPLTPREFEELLPFYVNGTLEDASRERVDAYLRAHPAAEGELRWHRTLQQRLREDVPAVSSEVGLDRAMARIRAERTERTERTERGPDRAAAGARAPAAPVPSLGRRLADWLGGLVPQPMLRPALAAALSVVAVQALVIGGMVGQPADTSEFRAVPGAPVVETGPWLKVNFKADAREADIRLLLVQVNAQLASGPGQLGDYYLRLPEGGLPVAERTLRASPLVEAVATVDALPPRP